MDALLGRLSELAERAPRERRPGLREAITKVREIRRRVHTCHHPHGAQVWNLVREAMEVVIETRIS
jgi:hypothetical protein